MRADGKTLYMTVKVHHKRILETDLWQRGGETDMQGVHPMNSRHSARPCSKPIAENNRKRRRDGTQYRQTRAQGAGRVTNAPRTQSVVTGGRGRRARKAFDKFKKLGKGLFNTNNNKKKKEGRGGGFHT